MTRQTCNETLIENFPLSCGFCLQRNKGILNIGCKMKNKTNIVLMLPFTFQRIFSISLMYSCFKVRLISISSNRMIDFLTICDTFQNGHGSAISVLRAFFGFAAASDLYQTNCPWITFTIPLEFLIFIE